MSLFLKIADYLDKHNFLNYRLWEFSLLNINRSFPYYFLLKLFFIHPIKLFKGFRFYQKLVGISKKDSLIGTISFAELINNLTRNNKKKVRRLIAPGFCMKPFDMLKNTSTCPVGQANHDCLILDKTIFLSTTQESWQRPCNECSIGKLVSLSASLESDLYIMTSAIDIARDLFLPATKSKEECLGLFFLCPYSTEAFTFGLALSGISGAMITFCAGDCSNHQEWTRADLGIKNEQTFVDSNIFNSVINELSNVAEKYFCANDSIRYTKKNNVYVYKN